MNLSWSSLIWLSQSALRIPTNVSYPTFRAAPEAATATRAANDDILQDFLMPRPLVVSGQVGDPEVSYTVGANSQPTQIHLHLP
jgi:hypothetical protein